MKLPDLARNSRSTLAAAARGAHFHLERSLRHPRSAELRQVPCREDEALFAAQGAVFVFDAEDAAVAVCPQVIDVFAPMDVARTGNDIAPPAVAVDAHASPHLGIHQRIFGVRMENTPAEHRDGQKVVALLVNQVGRVVVEAEIVVLDGVEKTLERVDALQTGFKPVLDADSDPLVFGVRDDRGVNLGDNLLDLVVRNYSFYIFEDER